MVKKYGDLFLWARKQLRQSEGEQAAVCARELLCLASGKTAAELIADSQMYASEQIELRLSSFVSRVLHGEPLAYVLGSWSFYGLPFQLTRDVLIPRDDTMAVTELAIEAARQMDAPQRVLDLCTGSGCIGLAIAHTLETARLTLTDVSPAAVRIAKNNALSLHLGARVSVFEADVMQPPPAFFGLFDLIVSNPPYVTREQMQSLEPSVRDYEPHLALDGGEDGLDFYRAVCDNYAASLRPGGKLAFEFGFGQQLFVSQIMAEAGFKELTFRKDWRGAIRAVIGEKDKN